MRFVRDVAMMGNQLMEAGKHESSTRVDSASELEVEVGRRVRDEDSELSPIVFEHWQKLLRPEWICYRHFEDWC